MEKLNVFEFEADRLRLLDPVRVTGEALEILKNGKPLAGVLPPPHQTARKSFGSMKARLFSGPLGDVMASTKRPMKRLVDTPVKL